MLNSKNSWIRSMLPIHPGHIHSSIHQSNHRSSINEKTSHLFIHLSSLTHCRHETATIRTRPVILPLTVPFHTSHASAHDASPHAVSQNQAEHISRLQIPEPCLRVLPKEKHSFLPSFHATLSVYVVCIYEVHIPRKPNPSLG